MPTLCFVGDVHGALVSMYAQVQKWIERTGTRVDGIVQVGDLGVYGAGTNWSTMWANRVPAPIPTWVAMGNHEDPNFVRMWQRDLGRIPGMRLLLDGEISNVLGVKIGCVWGNYSPISWLDPGRVTGNRLSGASERIAMHIDRAAVERLLANPAPMDVLVTHESAAATLPVQFRGVEMDPVIKKLLGLTRNENVGGCPGFDQILKQAKPARYFFGHVHCFDEGMVGDTHYTCLNAINYSGDPWMKVVEFPSAFQGVPEHESLGLIGGGN